MICKPCREGGTWNRMGNEANAPVLPVNSNAYRLNAVNAHARCEAPTTCPCHHKTGTFVNPTSRPG